jgi:hypothetical protein
MESEQVTIPADRRGRHPRRPRPPWWPGTTTTRAVEAADGTGGCGRNGRADLSSTRYRFRVVDGLVTAPHPRPHLVLVSARGRG